MDFSMILNKYVIPVVGVIAVLLIARWAAAWAGRIVEKGLVKSKFDETLTKFFANMTRWTILVVAILACLNYFGFQTTSFAAIIGGATLAIGLAFQGSLANFASGVMLLVFRPFGVKDVVKIAGETGKIDEIGLFTTTIDTTDNRRIIIPNKSVFGSTIENVTFHPKRRVDVNVGCDYGADLDQCREVLMQAIKATKNGLEEPAPAVVLTGLGGSSVDWQVRLWCDTPNYFAVKDELTVQVKKHLDAANIGIPFPQMDVHLDGALKR